MELLHANKVRNIIFDNGEIKTSGSITEAEREMFKEFWDKSKAFKMATESIGSFEMMITSFQLKKEGPIGSEIEYSRKENL